ncbi:hypothetical protein [Luteimonas deserti]|uniref:Lipoprotein n=1 Tax=Luteimonas deserti TaxID=2752306 RepID=A0A7Z0TYM1_9GAMM|nr:hypothetical protein [Luteimonas deserti]NYZ61283.1 hypothetical protein [Luteimonas deserti]
MHCRRPHASSSTARALALAVASILLGACTPSSDADRPTPDAPDPGPAPATAGRAHPGAATATAPGDGTIGGDGSDIRLDALEPDDVAQADLQGELACTFTVDGAPLLLALGVVGARVPAQGVVKVAGHVERISAPGGFEGMTGHPVFTGRGMTLRLVTRGAPLDGGESPARAATMTYQRADGASRRFEGRWECGP